MLGCVGVCWGKEGRGGLCRVVVKEVIKVWKERYCGVE